MNQNQSTTVEPNPVAEPSDSGKVATPPKPIHRSRQKFNRLIDSPELQELSFLEKEFLRERWLDQMIWFGDKASRYQRYYSRLRVAAIIGSILVPVLVTLSVSLGSNCGVAPNVMPGVSGSVTPAQPLPQTPPPNALSASVPARNQKVNWSQFFFYTGLLLSQGVAILSGIDQFFKYGDRWRQYRGTAELLKTHGWQFFELSGSYASYSNTGKHKAAFPVFASKVEEIIQSDVDGYVSQIAAQKSSHQMDSHGRF